FSVENTRRDSRILGGNYPGRNYPGGYRSYPPASTTNQGTVGVGATLEKAPQPSTTAVIATLEKPASATTAVQSTLEATQKSTTAVSTSLRCKSPSLNSS